MIDVRCTTADSDVQCEMSNPADLSIDKYIYIFQLLAEIAARTYLGGSKT